MLKWKIIKVIHHTFFTAKKTVKSLTMSIAYCLFLAFKLVEVKILDV